MRILRRRRARVRDAARACLRRGAEDGLSLRCGGNSRGQRNVDGATRCCHPERSRSPQARCAVEGTAFSSIHQNQPQVSRLGRCGNLALSDRYFYERGAGHRRRWPGQLEAQQRLRGRSAAGDLRCQRAAFNLSDALGTKRVQTNATGINCLQKVLCRDSLKQHVLSNSSHKLRYLDCFGLSESEGLTHWRWRQSSANPSIGRIPY